MVKKLTGNIIKDFPLDPEQKKRLSENREKRFKCEVTPCAHSLEVEEYDLAITHSGSLWSSISLTPKEIKVVIEKLQQKLSIS